jgi:hypothetical protein
VGAADVAGCEAPTDGAVDVVLEASSVALEHPKVKIAAAARTHVAAAA